ncbi:MAG: hypothetical protein ACHBNF_15350 [Chromatiales bacterium]
MKKEHVPAGAADRLGQIQVSLVAWITMQQDDGRVRPRALRDINDSAELSALATDHDRLHRRGIGRIDRRGIHEQGIELRAWDGCLAPGPGDNA